MMITNKDDERLVVAPGRAPAEADKNSSTKKSPTAGAAAPHKKRFPFRLNDMLNDAESLGHEHIVSWLPCGKMFKVHKHKEFASRVMPLYCRHSQYKSFLRQLSMYKYIRTNEGPLRGCYHHPNFQRNRFDLIEKINRTDRGGNGGDSLALVDDSAASQSKAAKSAKKNKKGNSIRKTGGGQPAAAASAAAMKRMMMLKEDASSSSDSESGTEVGEEFELIDVGNDSIKNTADLRTTTQQEGSTPMLIMTANSIANRHRSLNSTMRSISTGSSGLFDLRQDDPPRSPMTMPVQRPPRTHSELPTISSSFFRNTPEDILQEIIKTFGKGGVGL